MKTLKLLLFAAILIGAAACYNESVDDYPEYDIPSDVYVGDNTLIHSIEGCDSLYVKDVNIFIKTSAGEIISRRATHRHNDGVSEFTLQHGLVEDSYHLLYAEIEGVDDKGEPVTLDYGLGCRIAFRDGEFDLLSKYNRTFNMYSSGTEVDTLYITSVDDVVDLVNMSNDIRYMDKFSDNTYFLQMIDLNGRAISKRVSSEYGWIPIGWQSSIPFRGTYDGGGHSITGLWINREYMTPVAFVGFSDGASVRNLSLKDASLKGDLAVGGIVGVATSSQGKRKITYIDNCSVSNSRIAGASDSYAVGGILGIVDYESQALVHRCRSLGNTISAHSQAGGIVGGGVRTSMLSAYNCENSSDVSSEYNSCGGIVGMCDSLVAGGCVNRGFINGAHKFVSHNKELGQGNVGCGGIAGGTGVSYFVGCLNEGKVQGRSGVGGIVGSARFTGGDSEDEGYSYNNVAMSYCANRGAVTGDEFVGGLCGEAQYGIYGGYNEGSVTANGNYAGGIIGTSAFAAVHNCVNMGVVTADSYAGGIVGLSSTCSIAVNQNYGNVQAHNTHAAGIIAFAGNRATLNYCTNYGDIIHTVAVGGGSTRGLTVSEYFGGVFSQMGNPNEMTPMEIASIVYAAGEAAFSVVCIPIGIVGGIVDGAWATISTAAAAFGLVATFFDGAMFVATGVTEMVGWADFEEDFYAMQEEVQNQCGNVENMLSLSRKSFNANIPSNFEPKIANEEFFANLESLVRDLKDSNRLSAYNYNINEQQYELNETMIKQAKAKDITHSVLSGIFITCSLIAGVTSIVMTGGGAAPIVAGVCASLTTILGSANSIWETCTTYEQNCVEVSQCSNYGNVRTLAGSSKVGGIAGVAEENIIIKDCFNAGGGNSGGHIVGEMKHKSKLMRSLSIADAKNWDGGMYSSADNNADIEGLYFHNASGSHSMPNAVGLSTAQIGDKSSYVGWNIDSNGGMWEIVEGVTGSYPIVNVSQFQ